MKNKIRIIIQEIFYIISVALLIFVALELVWPRVVLAYINVSLVLILWLIIAIILLVIPTENET